MQTGIGKEEPVGLRDDLQVDVRSSTVPDDVRVGRQLAGHRQDVGEEPADGNGQYLLFTIQHRRWLTSQAADLPTK